MTLIDRAFRAVTVFTVGLSLLRIAEVGTLLKLHALFLSASAGTMISQTELADAGKLSVRLFPIGLIVFVAYLISLSAFTFAAYRGLIAARVPHLRFNPASAALLYFVPIWNLFHLLIVPQELFRASQYDATKAEWLDWREEERSDRISAAWLFIVGGMLFDAIGTVFLSRMPEPDVFVLVFRGRMISSLLAVTAVFLYLGAMASITKRVNALAVESDETCRLAGHGSAASARIATPPQ